MTDELEDLTLKLIAAEHELAKARAHDADMSVLLATVVAQRREVEGQAAALRAVLEWLDRVGGLGLDAHERIKAALQSDTGAPYLEGVRALAKLYEATAAVPGLRNSDSAYQAHLALAKLREIGWV